MDISSRFLHQIIEIKACWTAFDTLTDQSKYSELKTVGGVLEIDYLDKPPATAK